ncbi:MAG: DUF4886 domain-containing protein [Clostridia bacterium]|nr:DUF4886 domain-containing protein [Clostridia bacterium]
MRILAIGNSFAADTMEHVADIAGSMGVNSFKFTYLYIGGCSINRHFSNATNNAADYQYFVNEGSGWEDRGKNSIYDAIKEEKWDYISIQHGTGDKSRYTSPESYVNLSPLIEYVKKIAHKDVKIAFNMAWVPEPDSTHHEIVSYDGNQALMYEKLTDITKNIVMHIQDIDVISPAGTAIQNARTCIDKKLTRDRFHLSYDLGRYIAGLTFLKALYGVDLSNVKWSPEGVTDDEVKIAKKAAQTACEQPFSVTELVRPETQN